MDREFFNQIAIQYPYVDIEGFLNELYEWQHEADTPDTIYTTLDTVFDIFCDHIYESEN